MKHNALANAWQLHKQRQWFAWARCLEEARVRLAVYYSLRNKDAMDELLTSALLTLPVLPVRHGGQEQLPGEQKLASMHTSCLLSV